MSLREQKKLRARQTILITAEDLIGRHGYSDTTMRQIAAGADLSYQTVYNYFPTKALILQGLLTRDIQALALRIDTLINRYNGDLLDMLNQITEARMDMVDSLDPGRSLWRELCIDLLRQKKDASSIYRLIDTSAHDRLQAIIRKAQGMGHLRDSVDASLVAHTLYCLSEFAFVEYVMDPTVQRVAIMRTLDEQIDLLISPYLLR